jgi:hypothetical protein
VSLQQVEDTMRLTAFAITALAVMLTGLLAPNRAEALTLPAPSGLATAIPETRMAEAVAWRCTNFWNGRWHRWARCFWVPRFVYRHYGRIGPRFHFGHRHHRHRYWR